MKKAVATFTLATILLLFSFTTIKAADWVKKTVMSGAELFLVCYGNNAFITIDGNTGKVYKSTDNGQTWIYKTTLQPVPGGLNASPGKIVYSNGKFTAIDYYSNGIYTSIDEGENWTTTALSKTADEVIVFNGIARGNNEYIAFGFNKANGFMVRSSDGTSWDRVTAPASSEIIQDGCFINGKYVVIGKAASGKFISTSTDGTSWTNQTLPATFQNTPMAITFGNNLYVIVDDAGNIFTSPDGISWSGPVYSAGKGLYCVTYDNGYYYAVGSAGLILKSSDGTHWTEETSGVTTELYSIKSGNGQFIVSGSDGTILLLQQTATPTISSATYDATTGSLVVTGTDFVAKAGSANDIDASMFSITGEGGAIYTLTSTPDVEISSPTSFTITLDATDKAEVNQMINKNGLSSTDNTVYNLAAAANWCANVAGAADLTGNAMTASNVAIPTITGVTYNVVSGVLSVTGTGFLRLSGSANDINVSRLTITGEGAGSRTLTGSSVEITNGTSFTTTLTGADKTAVDLLLNQNGTSSLDATTYNLSAAEDWAAGADAAVNVVANTNGITVSGVATAKLNQTITNFNAIPNKTYGDASFVVSATAGASGESLVFSSDNASVASCNGTTITIVGAGSTTIRVNQQGNASYNAAAEVTAALTVNPATLTVTGATAQNKTYDGNTTATITGASLVGILNGDDVTVSGGGTFASASVADGISVTANLTLGGTKAGNYSLTQPTGLTANITAAAKLNQTITNFNAIPNKTYGDAPFVVSATAGASGESLVFTSDNASVASCNGTTITIVGAGSTIIRVNQQGNASYNAAEEETVSLTINPKAITVTVDPLQSKVYGAAETNLTYTNAPALIGTDAFTGSLERTAGENVSVYPISQGTLSAGSNYSLSFVGGSFSITPKPIVITADASQSKSFGAADPASFSYQVSPSLVGTDALTGKLSRIAGESVSVYPITIGNLDAGSNYSVTFVSNSFTINKKALTANITASPNLEYVKGGATVTFTATYDDGCTFTGAPKISFAGAGTTLAAEMTSITSLIWMYQWDPTPSTGDGTINISLAVPDAEGKYDQSFRGKTSIVLDNTIPTVSLNSSPAVDFVKGGDVLNFTATLSDLNGINESPAPRITIGNEVLTVAMNKVSNTEWTFAWTVPADINKSVEVTVSALDRAGNSNQSSLVLKNLVIDNIKPDLFSPTLTCNLIGLSAVQQLTFNEPILVLPPFDTDLKSAIIFKLHNKNGQDLDRSKYTVELSKKKGSSTALTIKSSLLCDETYYLAIQAGAFKDRAGNLNTLIERTFSTDPSPAVPVVAAASTANDKAKLCPGDLLNCTNTAAYSSLPISYQWKLDGNDLSGQSSTSYVMPEGAKGVYSLYVKNTTTGCSSTSATVTEDTYSILHPSITAKKETGIVSLLLVDNTSNSFVGYAWSKADGSAVGSSVVSDRQFLTLPGSLSSGSYKVLVTDKNGCKVMSDVKTVKSAPATMLYPTENDGAFKLLYSNEAQGRVILRAINQFGVVASTVVYEKELNAATIDVDMKGLAVGAYTLEITMGASRETAKFFVK